jgi:hypothetical protein
MYRKIPKIVSMAICEVSKPVSDALDILVEKDTLVINDTIYINYHGENCFELYTKNIISIFFKTKDEILTLIAGEINRIVYIDRKTYPDTKVFDPDGNGYKETILFGSI